MTSNTKTLILEAASNCFGEKGYAATAMSEIAKEANVTKASLYYFFKDKDELYLAVLSQAMAQAHTFVRQIASEQTNEQAVHAITQRLLHIGQQSAIFSRMPDMSCLKQNTDALTQLHAEVGALKSALTQILEAAKVTRPQIAVEIWLHAIHGYIKSCSQETVEIDLEAYAEDLTARILFTHA